MKRLTGLCIIVTVLALGLCASAETSVGLALGLDPTGLLIISAVTEMQISGDFDLRAEAGIATDEIAGLMLATATMLYHFPLDVFDPFLGIGGGFALTPPPYSTGAVVEAVGGVRIVPFEPVAVFGQIRFLVRWSGAGVTTGPIYEAGVQIRF